jgi:hypothetical protein
MVFDKSKINSGETPDGKSLEFFLRGEKIRG